MPAYDLRRACLFAAILAALASPAARAQTPPEEKASVLETVTVTAQRRVEDVRQVPIAITTVAEEKLDVIGSGGEDVRFLSARLPSLLIESSFGRTFPRFYVRGLGNTDFDLNASQPVSLVFDDVVQETLLTVHRARHTYDPSRPFRAWLRTIAERRAIDLLRRQGRQRSREVHDEIAYETHPAAAQAPVAEVDAGLRQAIDGLPEGQRQAIEELTLKDRSLAEAARATGRSPGALKVNLHRALKTLPLED